MESKTNKTEVEQISERIKNIDINKEVEEQDTKNEKKPESTKYLDFISQLKENRFKSIIFMTGAGISTSSGIPDFRSKGGLFQQLQEKYELSTPEEFFDINTFKKNPMIFYEFSKDFLSADYQPSQFHYFMSFLTHKGLVKFIFTQNIDGLELKAGIPKDKIIFAHGNFLEAHCPKCHLSIDINELNKKNEKGEILYCPNCKKKSPCKWKVVFYGEDLDQNFYLKRREITEGDLGIICGTSLLVQPFCLLPYMMNKNATRVLINRDMVGETRGKAGFKFNKEDSHDLFIQGYSDDIALQIIKDCGWEKEFDEFIKNLKNQS